MRLRWLRWWRRRRTRAQLVGARVNGLVVPAQVDLALEGAHALVARVGLVAGVLARVRYQVRRLAERLAAHLALVRLLARVYIGVLLHVRLLVEALVAVRAGIGSGVRVDEQVRRERRRALEGFAALATQERASAGRLLAKQLLALLGRLLLRAGRLRFAGAVLERPRAAWLEAAELQNRRLLRRARLAPLARVGALANVNQRLLVRVWARARRLQLLALQVRGRAGLLLAVQLHRRGPGQHRKAVVVPERARSLLVLKVLLVVLVLLVRAVHGRQQALSDALVEEVLLQEVLHL